MVLLKRRKRNNDHCLSPDRFNKPGLSVMDILPN